MTKALKIQKMTTITITVMAMMLKKKEEKLVLLLAANTIQHHRVPWKKHVKYRL